MHRNSNGPRNNFYKNTNVQPVQINATTGERFQTQNRKSLTVKNNTYKYITLNQLQSEGLWNEETHQHWDIQNRCEREQSYWISSETASEIYANKKTSYIT